MQKTSLLIGLEGNLKWRHSYTADY